MNQTTEYKTSPATREAVRNYAERQRQQGLVQIKLWVPERAAFCFHDAASRLRAMHSEGKMPRRGVCLDIREVTP